MTLSHTREESDTPHGGGQGGRTLTDWFDPDANWPPTALTGLNDVVDVEDAPSGRRGVRRHRLAARRRHPGRRSGTVTGGGRAFHHRGG
ncbi:hypothetical protein ACWEQ8_00130 [Streptomyces noursei]